MTYVRCIWWHRCVDVFLGYLHFPLLQYFLSSEYCCWLYGMKYKCALFIFNFYIKLFYRYRLQFFVEYVPFNLCVEWGSGGNFSGNTTLRIVMQVISKTIISLHFITKTSNGFEFFCFVEIFSFIRKNKTHCFQINKYPLKSTRTSVYLLSW